MDRYTPTISPITSNRLAICILSERWYLSMYIVKLTELVALHTSAHSPQTCRLTPPPSRASLLGGHPPSPPLGLHCATRAARLLFSRLCNAHREHERTADGAPQVADDRAVDERDEPRAKPEAPQVWLGGTNLYYNANYIN